MKFIEKIKKLGLIKQNLITVLDDEINRYTKSI